MTRVKLEESAEQRKASLPRTCGTDDRICTKIRAYSAQLSSDPCAATVRITCLQNRRHLVTLKYVFLMSKITIQQMLVT